MLYLTGKTSGRAGSGGYGRKRLNSATATLCIIWATIYRGVIATTEIQGRFLFVRLHSFMCKLLRELTSE